MIRREELGALTTLRFVAAAWVVGYHVLAPRGRGPAPLVALERSGFAGVSLFFVLSGFVLAYNYPRVTDVRAFARARAARIVPVYLLSLAITIPLFVHDAGTGSIRNASLVVLTTLTFTQAWYGHSLKWNFPAWSVSVEVFLYVMYPFLFARLLRVSWRRAFSIVACCWGATVVAAIAFSAARPGGVSLASRGTDIEIAKYLPIFHVSEFLVGVLAARVFMECPRALRRFRAAAPLTVAILGAVLLASDHLPYLALHDALFAPLFGAVVLSLASVDVRARAFLMLGRASYAIYLLHVPLLSYSNRFGSFIGLRGASMLAAYAAVLLAVALSVFRIYEEPMRRMLRARAERSGQKNRKRTDEASSSIPNPRCSVLLEI